MAHCSGNGPCCGEPCYTLSAFTFGAKWAPPFLSETLCQSSWCRYWCCCGSVCMCGCGKCATSPCAQCCWAVCAPCRVPFLAARLCLGLAVDISLLCCCTPFRFKACQWLCGFERTTNLFASADNSCCCVFQVGHGRGIDGSDAVVWYRPSTIGALWYLLCCTSLELDGPNGRRLVDKCACSKFVCRRQREACQTGQLWTSIGTTGNLTTTLVASATAFEAMTRF